MVIVAQENLDKTNLLPITKEEPFVEETPSFLEVTQSAFSTTNTIGSAIAGFADGVLAPRQDFDYDALSQIRGTIYENFSEEFWDVDSDQDLEIVKARIDRRFKDKNTLRKAGWLGTGMELVAAIADPVNIVGFGLGTRAGTQILSGLKNVTSVGAKTGVSAAVIDGAVPAAVGSGVASAASEAVLVNVDPTRTTDEAFVNIGVNTAIGAVLGGTIFGVSTAMREKFSKEVVADNTPKMRAKRQEERQVAREVAEDLHGPDLDLGVGAAEVRQPTLEDLTIQGEAAQQAAKLFKRMNPQFNLAQSPSLESRKLGQQLMTSDFVFNQNSAFYATPHSIENKLLKYNALEGYAIENLQTHFQNYQRRVRNEMGVTGTKPLTYEQFDQAVGVALMRQEASAIPEVVSAAQYYRHSVYDPVLKRAQATKLLGENIQPRNALSYFPTQYNYAAINADRQGLKQVIMNRLPESYAIAEKKRIAAESLREKLLAQRAKIKITTSSKKVKGVTKEVEKGATAKAEARRKELDKKILEVEDRLDDYRKAEVMTESDFSDIADEIIGSIQGLRDGLAFKMRIPLTKGPLKHKTLDFIPQDELAPWLKTRASEVTSKYLRAIAPEIEMHSTFGSVDLKDRIAVVNREYADLINKTSDPKKIAKLQAQRDNDIKDIDALVGRLRGTYGRPTDADGVITNALQVSRMLNVVTKLGGTAVSMVPDFGRIIAIRGFRKTFSEALAPMMSNMKAFKVSAEEAKRSGAIWETVLNNNRALNMAELIQPSYGDSRVQKGLRALTDVYSKWNLTNYAEKVKREMSAVLIQNEMLESIEKLVAGRISKKEIEQLAASGIDGVTARRIAKMAQQHSRTEGSVRIANTQDWADRAAVAAYQGALNRQIMLFNTAPTIGTRPRFMSSEIGKTLLQFESFNLAATSKIMVAGLQQADARTVSSMLSMVGAGMMVYAYRQWANGRSVSDDPSVWISEGFENSGVFGALSSVNDRLSRATNDKVRAGAFLGAPGHGSKRGVDPYRSFAALLGPSGKTAVDLLTLSKLIDDQSRWNAYDTHALRQSYIPTQNLIGFRFLWDEIEDAFNSTIGVD
jgi:hypothetical protein